MAALACMLLAGCGGTNSKAAAEPAGTAAVTGQGTTAGKDSTSAEETALEKEAASEQEKASEKETGSGQAAASEQKSASDTQEGAVLEDGVYSADFDTDSGMFHVSEACDGKGTLTVKDGKMVIHVSLASKNIVNLFNGLAEDAKKDGADIIQPTTDAVTYSDGITEEVYGFDVQVPALDEEFDLAILGTKGKWYDHKVSVSNPEKAD